MSHHPARIARFALSFVIALLVFTVLALPPRSRAIQENQQSTGKKKSGKHDFVPGEVLVRFKSERMAKQVASSASVVVNGQELSINIERFDGADLVPGLRLARVAPEATLEAIEALSKRPDVMYAEPNYILHADVNPNDPFFGDLYGMVKIGAPTAWNTQQGSANVVVGVIDQGIDLNHQDLNANRFINPAPGSIPGFAGDVNGYNFVNNNGTVFDGNPSEDHGTHVAGIVGAVGNNSIGVVGVNWTVRLMSLRFLDGTGSGSTSDAVRACNYARQMRELFVSSGGAQGANLRVLNNSYGGGAFTNSFQDAITALNTAGVLFVAAAGNTSDDPEPDNEIVAHYPSSYNVPNVIGVANTNSTDGLNAGSHFGAKSVHVGAPGSSIRSTVPGNNYSFFTGTSMATPHVSGAAALLLAQNPSLTVAQLKNLLILNGDVVPALAGKTVTGRRINVANSFAAFAENDTAAPGAVTNLHLNSQTGRVLDVGWNASGDDGASGTAALYKVTFTDFGTGQTLDLKYGIPGSPGTPQTTSVTIPYRHIAGNLNVQVLDNVGNQSTSSIAISIPITSGDPYLPALTAPVALSAGGTRIFGNPTDDDRLQNFTLPFSFPFFGTSYTQLTISTNGNLFFSPAPHRTDPLEADDVPSSVGELSQHKVISGLWDDIDLRSTSRPDAGVYIVTPSADRVIFRWQGVPCNFNGSICTGGGPVNFEIELNSNGTIKSRYGSGNTSLFPVVGISGGEAEPYVITSHTSESTPKSLTNAQEVTYIVRSAPTAAPDYDSDQKADVSIYRPSNGTWFLLKSSTGFNPAQFQSFVWGTNEDRPVVGDYDGDGKVELAIYRPSNGVWYMLKSTANYDPAQFFGVGWGAPGDIPAPADYDGDGRTDIAIFRPSVGIWYILKSSLNFDPAQFQQVGWGGNGDLPMPGDYDGDKKADITIFRPSNGVWYILKSSTNYDPVQFQGMGWGDPGDVPCQSDFDGDGRTDVCIFRQSLGIWYILKSSANFNPAAFQSIGWGSNGDVPVPSDYDGDGKSDPAIFRPSNGVWYILKSSVNYDPAQFIGLGWGNPGDIPITVGVYR